MFSTKTFRFIWVFGQIFLPLQSKMKRKMTINNCKWLVLAMAFLLTSCIKEESKNMECDILSAWVDEAAEPYFYKTADMKIPTVGWGDRELTFTVRSLSALPDLALHFTLTPGATIEPANGSKQNFRNGPVRYVVTSEDGQWTKTYEVTFRQLDSQPSYLYSFENSQLDGKRGKYYEWTESGQGGIWATGNEGYYIAKSAAAASDYPTVPSDDGYEGKCVKMTTYDTGSWGRTFKKPIAAGNLFLGKFNSAHVLTNTLLTTEMGIAFDKIPTKVTGYYKYKSGEKFTDKNFNVLDRKDEACIYAVFYRNTDAAGNSVMLHGDDVKTHPNIVRLAEMASLPETSEWTRFEMTFEGSETIDLARLKNQGYNLTLVFSSSKSGDSFEGSVGSTLYIDEVEISYQSEEEL